MEKSEIWQNCSLLDLNSSRPQKQGNEVFDNGRKQIKD